MVAIPCSKYVEVMLIRCQVVKSLLQLFCTAAKQSTPPLRCGLHAKWLSERTCELIAGNKVFCIFCDCSMLNELIRSIKLHCKYKATTCLLNDIVRSSRKNSGPNQVFSVLEILSFSDAKYGQVTQLHKNEKIRRC